MFKSKFRPLRVDRTMLPLNFAEKLLEYETELDIHPSMRAISSLMQLYSVISIQRAIEYYESIKDPKHLHYQERLHNTLSKEQVMKILVLSKPKPKKRTISMTLNDEDVEIALNDAKTQDDKVTRKLRENLKDQEQRFEARKRVHRKTMSFDLYSKEVEAIIEESVIEKINRSNEIKQKYDNILQKYGEELTSWTRNKIDENMNSELNQMTLDLDARCKSKLEPLKKNLGIAL